VFDESYIEGRFGIVMEDIRDALAAYAHQSERIANSLEKLSKCVDSKAGHLPFIRVGEVKIDKI
jgi:hypothetical protein